MVKSQKQMRREKQRAEKETPPTQEELLETVQDMQEIVDREHRDLCAPWWINFKKKLDEWGGWQPSPPLPSPAVDPELILIPDDQLSEMEKAFEKRINSERFNEDRQPLVMSQSLQEVARDHVLWMAKNHKMEHQGKHAHGLESRLDRKLYDYSLAGQNIAWGSGNVSGVIRKWKDSKFNWRNLLRPQYTEMGAAVAESATDQDKFWCLVLAAPLKKNWWGWTIPKLVTPPGVIEVIDRPEEYAPRQTKTRLL